MRPSLIAALLSLMAYPAWPGAIELNGSTQKLTDSTALFSAYPWSASAFFKADTTHDGMILAMGDDASGDQYWYLGVTPSSTVTAAVANTTQVTAVTTTTWSTDTWAVGSGSFASTTSRLVYLDGGGEGSNVTSKAVPTGLDNTTVGVVDISIDLFFFNGSLAYMAAWDVSLSAEEHAILGLGFDPRLVAPASLSLYAPLISGDYTDKIGGVAFSATATPTEDPNTPRIFLAF